MIPFVSFLSLTLSVSLIGERKVCDSLSDRIKCLETELQKCNVPTISLDCSTILEPTNQRKRIKTEFQNEDSTNYDTSKDELNSAFHSTSIEDDVIDPTQFEPHQSASKKLKKISPSNKGHSSNEQNKENQNMDNLKANEKSPTVLSKNSKKSEVIINLVFQYIHTLLFIVIYIVSS